MGKQSISTTTAKCLSVQLIKTSFYKQYKRLNMMFWKAALALMVLIGLWAQVQSAPMEEDRLQLQGCDCKREDGPLGNGKCIKTFDKCASGFKCVCNDERFGFGFGACSGKCKK